MPTANEDSACKACLLDASEWTCIELAGHDREEWLQGQATNDVRLLKPGGRLSFCLCEPNGALLAVVDAWALEDRILLTTARELEAAVLDRVERMTILEDVSASVSPMVTIPIQGPGADHKLSELVALPEGDAGTAEFEGNTVYTLRSRRVPAGGWDIWVPRDRAGSITKHFEVMPAGEYEAGRIQAGIPKWSVDMGPKTLPPELGRDFEARHISYQKGCYTGQEVLMRIHSRGHTNRTWIGLLAENPLDVGTTVEHRGKPVGSVTSSARLSSGGFVAAATLRNEAAQEGENVRVGEAEAAVCLMPIR